MEDHLLDGTLARSTQSHQQDPGLCLAAAGRIRLQFKTILVVRSVAKVLGERVRRIVIVIVALSRINANQLGAWCIMGGD